MDYIEQLAKVFKGVTYKGCRIEHRNKMFYVFGKCFGSLDAAKKQVDEAKTALKKSIK